MKLCMVASYACLQVLKPFWYPYLPPLTNRSPKTALLGEMSLCPTNVLMSDKNVLMSDKMSLCLTNCPYVRQHTGGKQLRPKAAKLRVWDNSVNLIKINCIDTCIRYIFQNRFHEKIAKMCFATSTVLALKLISRKNREIELSHHSVVITEIYSHTFLAKISWNQHFS